MAAVIAKDRESTSTNPIDTVEQIAAARDWMFDRHSDEEMAIEVPGHWSDYRMFFSWLGDLCALHLACAFEMRVPSYRRADINDLLARINEKLAIGHFDLWADEGLPVFRQSVLLRGAKGATLEQLEDMVQIAITECERFYPAFQYVVWGGKTPSEAVEASMLETACEA
jgi:hypothetical protein